MIVEYGKKAQDSKEMILAAVKRIKSKGKFNYDKFKEDNC